jgi:hypothetical protein
MSANTRRREIGARTSTVRVLLGLLCLRALIPAGFMLAPIDGRLHIVLCDSNVHGPLHHHHGAHADPTCPYAQSSGPAPLPAFPSVVSAPFGYVAPASFELAQTVTPFGPTRQQSPRGPPNLA